MKKVSRFLAPIFAALLMAGCVSNTVINNGSDHLTLSPKATTGELSKGLAPPSELEVATARAITAPAVIESTPLPSDADEKLLLEATQARIVALEKQKAQLEQEIVKADAKIAAMEQAEQQFNDDLAKDLKNLAKDLREIEKAMEQITADALADDIARADARVANNEAIQNAVTGMPVPPASVSDETKVITLVSVTKFTAETPAEGWFAWKRQSQVWKKANPWEKVLAANCAREPKICKKTAPAGTVFLLPAPDVRVYVPEGVKAPEAITLAPTGDPTLFALDLSPAMVSLTSETAKRIEATAAALNARTMTGELASGLDDAQWVRILAPSLVGTILIALLLLVLFWERGETIRYLKSENAELKKSLNAKNCGTEQFVTPYVNTDALNASEGDSDHDHNKRVLDESIKNAGGKVDKMDCCHRDPPPEKTD